MNKKKMIVDIIGSEIERYGFTYGLEKAQSASNRWGFTREVNGIIQRIAIQEHRYTKAFFLGFSTSAWGNTLDKRAGTDIALPPTYRNRRDQWHYETEEEMKAIFTEFLEIIENYGLKKLDEMSIEPEVLPTNEMGEKLISSPEALSHKFIQDNQIDNLEMSEENMNQWFDLVETKLLETKDHPYDDDIKEMLVEISAFLGEQLKKVLGGNWRTGIEARIISLANLNVNGYTSFWILNDAMDAWSKGDVSDFKEKYHTLLRNKM